MEAETTDNCSPVPNTPMATDSTQFMELLQQRGGPPAHAAPLPKRLLYVVERDACDQPYLVSRLRSHEIVAFKKCANRTLLVDMNQRLAMVIAQECNKCCIKVLDSAVVTSRTARLIDCTDCTFVFEDVDIRNIECFGLSNCNIYLIGDTVLLENIHVVWREGNRGNSVHVAGIVASKTINVQFESQRFVEVPDTLGNRTRWITTVDTDRKIRLLPLIDSLGAVAAAGATALERLRPLLNPALGEDELRLAAATGVKKEDILQAMLDLYMQPLQLLPLDFEKAYDEERREYCEPEESFTQKVEQVADWVRSSRYTVFYTGAGISTAAGIPDFRGPQGVWTERDKGRSPTSCNPYDSFRPTFCHYAITQMVRQHWAHFVITTNCDGLQVKSGLPPHCLVELHGNVFKETCEFCKQSFYRDYVVVVHKATHITGSTCDFCHSALLDTCVAFGENYRNPLDPVVASFHAKKADLAIVLGTSMNVQSAASYPEKALLNPGGKMVLVNLQATPCVFPFPHPTRTDLTTSPLCGSTATQTTS
eukprot:TRINITY_DN1070_c0_g1_i4.p1 TRINITY_DN1070_c0_g1~~TRINITY_DN1070_c0_g1_i4.p1  ORF type:complete len:544 (+),score=85.14 TRINITY_DN1070_c0_g1_i4:27-1634(+)